MKIQRLRTQDLEKGIHSILKKHLRLTRREKNYFEDRLRESEMLKSVRFVLAKNKSENPLLK